ncbi:M13 family metallopeptidase [Neolewinella agarilytica]|uniref:M13 family metallopeptidase n=1 Tax=Neolewinella agarilytica TaxID=478744 RepID=UPI0023572E9E|nr:M13 family metallopeptidase [Neolewinella agarilytica]
MKNIIYLRLAAFALALTACGSDPTTTTPPVDDGPHGIILDNMDTDVDPKDDFYNYVNGSWVKNTTIPADRTIWGGFGVLTKATDADVLAILEEAKTSGQYTADTDQAKALAIFDTKLNMEARNELGVSPLASALEDIESIQSVTDLQTVLATNPNVGHPFLSLSSFPDLSNSTVNGAYVGPNGLGLPDRDFYLDEDEKSIEIREEYVKHVSRMLQFLGDEAPVADAAAKKILDLETKLAEPRLNKVESRDARNYNNRHTLEETEAMIPSMNVKKFLSDLGVENTPDTLIVTQPRYMAALQTFLTTTPMADVKDILRWHTIADASGKLTTEIEDADWEFYAKYLNGAKEKRPADERALNTVNGTVGEALGQLYVDAKFPPEAKAKAEEMIADVIKAYQQRIEKLDWMSAETKAKAIEKLDKFTVKIGYPDEWEDYSAMEVTAENSYFDNMSAVSKWGRDKNLSEIGQPVDKSEWGMSPQTVNAYFNPLNNEIVFPAAILQPPFYDYLADDAVNYGGIGAVIGHEISHAFDDSGARFDGDGNLANWWTDQDLEEFTKRGDALAAQYSAIEVMDSVFINGKFTLGENIGDLGGVLGAYDGLMLNFERNGRPENIDGFTPEQRFFMSWATVWRTLSRDDALRNQVKTDPHSPGKTRATQPLVNIDAFYEAFDIKEGDGMWLAPADRVRIW